MRAVLWVPLLLPPLLGAFAVSTRRHRRVRGLDLAAAVAVLVSGLVMDVAVRTEGPLTAAAGLLRVDELTAYLLTTVGAVAVTALWAALSTPEPPGGAFTALVCLFLTAMSLAVLADNLGVLWVAVEATTIATAFLVGYHQGRPPLEAAWKYVVLGSVGVAIAFLGIVLLYAAARAGDDPTLSWTGLMAEAGRLNPAVTKLAVALAALGFATKAGLAPMHSWLPDAHAQAPAAVSGLMSGVLLSVALYAILRIKALGDAVLGIGFMRGLLLTLGLLSLAVAAGLVLTQRDYKRLLAYSSIEHMGLMTVGAAIGGRLATAAVLVHMLAHGLVKAAMFVQAGRILTAEGSTRIADVRGLMARRPDLAAPFLAGTAALLGFPPFVLFFTEVAIVLAGWQAGLGWVMGAVLALLLLTAAGIGRHVLSMTLGPDPAAPAPGGHAPRPGNQPGPRSGNQPGPRLGTRPAAQLPIALALTAVAVAGLAAWPIRTAVTAAVAALGGGS